MKWIKHIRTNKWSWYFIRLGSCRETACFSVFQIYKQLQRSVFIIWTNLRRKPSTDLLRASTWQYLLYPDRSLTKHLGSEDKKLPTKQNFQLTIIWKYKFSEEKSNIEVNRQRGFWKFDADQVFHPWAGREFPQCSN